MLLEVASVCALALGIVMYLPRKTWSAISTSLLWTIKYNIIGSLSIMDDVFNRKYNKIELSSMVNKVAIVTGSSRGIGAVVVKKLLQCDMEVIVACRTISAGERTLREIRDSGITTGQGRVIKLDNSSLESVREFAEQVKKDYKKIHILINNAGVMFCPYQETKDGFEEQWAVNYLSHFLLTSLLIPLLKAGGRVGDYSRIINVSSCAYKCGTINFENINLKGSFVTYAAYAQSKLAQLMFTVTLQKFLDDKLLNIRTYCVHPGIVNTDLFKYTYLRYAKWFMAILKTPDQGATSIFYAAISKDIEGTGGLYFSNCKEVLIDSTALEHKKQERLFEMSLKQVNLSDFFQE